MATTVELLHGSLNTSTSMTVCVRRKISCHPCSSSSVFMSKGEGAGIARKAPMLAVVRSWAWVLHSSLFMARCLGPRTTADH